MQQLNCSLQRLKQTNKQTNKQTSKCNALLQKLVKAKKTKMEWYPSVTIERKWHHSTVYRNMLGFVWSVCQCVVPKGVPRTTVLSWWMPLSSGYWLGLSRVLLGSKFGSLGQDPTDFFLSFFLFLLFLFLFLLSSREVAWMSDGCYIWS